MNKNYQTIISTIDKLNLKRLFSLSIWFFILYLIVKGNYNLIVRYEENLHCTQYVSYRIVVHEKEKHEEENSTNIPIYDSKYQHILRVMFAVYFPAILFLPLFFTIGRMRRIGALKYAALLIALIGVNMVFVFAWTLLGGERAGWMAKLATFHTVLCVVLIVMGIIADKGIIVVFKRLQKRKQQLEEEP